MPKKTFAPVDIPKHFKELIEIYGFEDDKLLEKAVATRSTDDWYAILFTDGDAFFAVDFRYYGGPDSDDICSQRRNGYEIQNDDAGAFESIEEFKKAKLTLSFF